MTTRIISIAANTTRVWALMDDGKTLWSHSLDPHEGWRKNWPCALPESQKFNKIAASDDHLLGISLDSGYIYSLDLENDDRWTRSVPAVKSSSGGI